MTKAPRMGGQEQASGDLKRLAWRCRRGTRELDILMQGFLTRQYASLPEPSRRAFERLAELPDPELYELLTGQVTANDKDVGRVVERLRADAAFGA